MHRQSRPTAATTPDVDNPVGPFIQELQDALDTGDADLFNRHFANDVLWGTPFGAVVEGYDALHAIHAGMLAAADPTAPGSIYTIEHTRQISADVALAYVRRISERSHLTLKPGRTDGFDELALFVLVRRDNQWWLAAGQHVPDRRDVYE